jgi:hypothetical protein
VFVTAQGSVYSQFKRALKRQNFMLAWTMAAELPKVQRRVQRTPSPLCASVMASIWRHE